MNKSPLFHANVNLPVPFNDFEPLSNKFEERRSNLDLISLEFKDWLTSINLGIDRCMFFTSPPGKRYKIHIDGDPLEISTIAHAKINIIFNSYDSFMTWYKPKLGYEEGTTHFNLRNNPIRYWEKNNCDVIYRAATNKHCIINGGIMHDLVNSSLNQGNRRCYSLVMKDPKENRVLHWEELVERIQDYII